MIRSWLNDKYGGSRWKERKYKRGDEVRYLLKNRGLTREGGQGRKRMRFKMGEEGFWTASEWEQVERGWR